MKVLALTVAGFAALATPAAAQYIPRPPMPMGMLAPDDVFEIVREMGLDPIGRPVRNGPVWVQRAADYYGKPLRIVVDAARAQVVAVEPIGGPPGIYGGPHHAYGPRPYPYVASPDEEDAMVPRRPMVASRAQPHAALPPQGLPPATVTPKQKSAAVTPGRPPVPRKRPSAAPQETAGSVEPLGPAPKADNAPAATGSTPAAPTPTKPAAPGMTPVAPLD